MLLSVTLTEHYEAQHKIMKVQRRRFKAEFDIILKTQYLNLLDKVKSLIHHSNAEVFSAFLFREL